MKGHIVKSIVYYATMDTRRVGKKSNIELYNIQQIYMR